MATANSRDRHRLTKSSPAHLRSGTSAAIQAAGLSFMSFARRFFLILVLGSFVPHAQALILDWDGVTWTAGSLSNSYDIDPVRAGNDITVTVSGNTTLFQPEFVAPNHMTRAITKDFQGGLPIEPNALWLAVNFTDRVSFTRVPEINPVWSAVGSCVLAAVLILRHSAKFRK